MRSDSTPPLVAFLLCGGAGSRLRGVTDLPKGLIEVAGRPFLFYPVSAALEAGADRIVFLTGHRGEEIERAFGPMTEKRIFAREDRPLGTAGALRAARVHAGRANLILNGDSYVDLPLAPFVAAARPQAATILSVRMEDCSDYGVLDLDPDGRVRGFSEKASGAGGWINAGVYLLPGSMIEDLSEGPGSLEREVFPRWAADGRLYARREEAFFRDIGTPERLEAAQVELAPIRERIEREHGGTR